MLVSAKDMMDKARDGKYAVGQFNINNLEWTKAILNTEAELPGYPGRFRRRWQVYDRFQGCCRYGKGYGRISGYHSSGCTAPGPRYLRSVL